MTTEEREEFKQKQLDVLNSFVFNVDTPEALAQVYARYHQRGEPLDTLEVIQDRYIGADREGLGNLAKQFLAPERVGIGVVADKNTPVVRADGSRITLERFITRQAAPAVRSPWRPGSPPESAAASQPAAEH